jgi:hypothetical protein
MGIRPQNEDRVRHSQKRPVFAELKTFNCPGDKALANSVGNNPNYKVFANPLTNKKKTIVIP